MNVLVTGASGFVGQNLCVELARQEDCNLYKYDTDNTPAELENALAVSDVIYHLAGVNRPAQESEFNKVNAGLTETICNTLLLMNRSVKIVLASSIQAELKNPYGLSKLAAEKEVLNYAKKARSAGVIYRLNNLFGKWCRPNYNSVTATFCYNVAHNIPLHITDKEKTIELTYIDTVINTFVKELKGTEQESGFRVAAPLRSNKISLGTLAETIQFFHDHRSTNMLPDYSDRFTAELYATYLSYLNPVDMAYSLEVKADDRGSLAEFIKGDGFGQIFISRTKKGIIRGNHFHNTKTEKFMVVHGEAVISLRCIINKEIISFKVNGQEYKIVDIPPGYTHAIENVGNEELVTVFWASEVFDPLRPDTFYEKV